MNWVSVNDDSVEIPFTKVCIWDGANTFWAQLQKIEYTKMGRNVIFEVQSPERYPDLKPTHWLKIKPPEK